MLTAIMQDGALNIIYVIITPNHFTITAWAKTIIKQLNGMKHVNMNGVKISLHPAGHIIGSSQIRVEYKGEVWVVSGDYKTEDDGISGNLNQ